MNPKTTNYWYENQISNYDEEKIGGEFAGTTAYLSDEQTGEAVKEQVIHIFKPKHMGTHMNIDEKMIGKRYCTILSNPKSGKIAMLMESMNPGLIADALSCFCSEVLNKVKHICCDMSPMFKKLCKEWFSQAIVTVDKYHVIKHALDFLQGIRIEEKNNLSPDDHQQIEDTLWTRKQLLTKSRYLLFKAKEKWNDDEMIIAIHLFKLYPNIKLAYEYVQRLRQWYNLENKIQPKWWLEKHLEQWVKDIEQDFPKASSFIRKMLIKHQENIIFFFSDGLTNRKAENLNGKIQRFVANNYGLRNRDFFYYGLQVYFA
jgi:transposase